MEPREITLKVTCDVSDAVRSLRLVKSHMKRIASKRLDGALAAVACSIFSVKPGDVLAVMAPQTLAPEQRARLKDYVLSAVPEGVKVIVLDGGLTIAAITQSE